MTIKNFLFAVWSLIKMVAIGMIMLIVPKKWKEKLYDKYFDTGRTAKQYQYRL